MPAVPRRVGWSDWMLEVELAARLQQIDASIKVKLPTKTAIQAIAGRGPQRPCHSGVPPVSRDCRAEAGHTRALIALRAQVRDRRSARYER